jgi:ABC-type nitrate/sulfonate/bicarbonate transport system substrate-binding protein
LPSNSSSSYGTVNTAYGVSSFDTQHNASLALLSVMQESSELVATFIAHVHEAQHFLHAQPELTVQQVADVLKNEEVHCLGVAVAAAGTQGASD